MAGTKNQVTFDEFYSAVGRATTSWFLLEEGLRDVFSRLVICSVSGTMLNAGPEVMWVVGNIFHSSTNLRARLVMMSETMERLITDENILAEWNAVKNRVLDLYKRRNVLAHGAVYGNDQGAQSIRGPVLSSNLKSLTYIQVCACDQSFKKQAERLTKLAIAVNQHLVAKAEGRA